MAAGEETIVQFDARAWRRAIDTRVSRRAYDRTPLTAEESAKMRRFCGEFRPFPDARMELVEDPHLDAFTASKGGYGRITGAVAMLVFIGKVKSPLSDLHVGYVGEAAILEATRLGLATCWTHRFYSASKLERYVTLEYGERIVAASPIGHAVPGHSIGERLAALGQKPTKRLPAEQIATADCLSHARGIYRDLVEAARLAPSPMNRQAWRFSIDDRDRLCVTLSESAPVHGLSSRVDGGVAMLHIDVAARGAGHDGAWELDSGSFAARWRPLVTFVTDSESQQARTYA